ncbi:TfoX/Sxy family protein [Pararhodobacter sp.]|uniref:TfoX/Sxy family protein n=1 Tax=Pararhodobacter sp. TaxID=2127056 RepID=UPI002FE2BED6
MAYDEGMAQLLRESLAEAPDYSERRMFGGLCFMLAGNMVCGVHRRGGMFRVGAAQVEAALAVPGTRPMDFTGRPMTGFVEIGYDELGDDDTRAALLAMARSHVATLPPK